MNSEISYIRNGILVAITLFILAGVLSQFRNSSGPAKVSEGMSDYQVSADAIVQVSNPEGKRLFQTNCAACHSLYKDLTGPALAGVEERWPDRTLLKKWILNWSKAIATGDPYPKKIAGWSTATMNVFEGTLTDKDIEYILDYLESAGKKDRIVAVQ